MKKYNIVFVTILLLLLGSGCGKDWLDPKPLSFYTPENTFVDEAGLNAALVACLRNSRHEFYGDGMPEITENTFSDLSVEGTTDKTASHGLARANIA